MRIEKFTNLYRDVTKEGTKIPQEKYCLTGQFPMSIKGNVLLRDGGTMMLEFSKMSLLSFSVTIPAQ